MPHVKNDLKELVEDFKGTLKGFYTLVKDLSEAPPTIRKQPDVAVARLTHSEKGELGAFAPELYEMAREGTLKAQLEHKAWQEADAATRGALSEQPFYTQLFYVNADGQPLLDENGQPKQKTPFELAILPHVLNLDGGDKRKFNKNILKCEERIRDEFDNLKQKGLEPPLPVHKYRVQADYLRYAERAHGIKVEGVYDIVVNRANPKDALTKMEKWMHWLAQRAAFIATLTGALIVGEIISPAVAVATIVGSVLANLCSKEFGMFGLAESLIRELPRLTFKDIFGNSDTTYSIKKILKTVALLAALVMPTYGAAYLGWESIMLIALPLTKYWGVNMAIQGMQMMLASFFALVGGATLVSGATIAQRYFWGLGVQDTQVPLNDDLVKKLPSVRPKTFMEIMKKRFGQLIRSIDKKGTPEEVEVAKGDLEAMLYDFTKRDDIPWAYRVPAPQPAPIPTAEPIPGPATATTPAS